MRIFRFLVGIPIVALLVASIPSGAFASLNSHRLAPGQIAGYNGKAIFEGLMFGIGPVAALFPEDTAMLKSLQRSRHTNPTDPANLKTIGTLEAGYEKVDPGFFNRFASQMGSGDPGAVNLALERTKSDLDLIGKANHFSIKNGPVTVAASNGPTTKVLVAYSFAFALGAFNLAVLIYLAAILYIGGIFVLIVGANNTDGPSLFRFDKAVARIALRLEGRASS